METFDGEMEELYKEVKHVLEGCIDVSVSLLQLRFGIGFAKAGRILERLHEDNFFRDGSTCSEEEMQRSQRRQQEILMEGIRRSPRYIDYIEQTPELCMAAVQQDGMALKFVRQQTLELCLAAVQQNGMAL
ncbi:MAG: DUF4116 domain-containing protein, partial [Mailhella sp.]